MSSIYKICDSVHGFIRFGSLVHKVIDSEPFQRLRYIRQMGVAYLVYPGASHSRFEHSLGVMDLATRIYDALISRPIIDLPAGPEELKYWRKILRAAALCHDLGHLPFSHTAESSLLPEGGHEAMTLKIVKSENMSRILKNFGTEAQNDILKLAAPDLVEADLSSFEKVLSQIITEDNFGADRIDYLIRDGFYTGVRCGNFDYHQLIDSLRLLPHNGSLALGIDFDGIQSVEALWIARYMMYARVYQHPKSRSYTNHMRRFMLSHYKNGISREVNKYIDETDYKILSALQEASKKEERDAEILLKKKKPFKEFFLAQEIPTALKHELIKEFQTDVMLDELGPKTPKKEFPVLCEGNKIISSSEASVFLRDIPSGQRQFRVYVNQARMEDLKSWIHEKIDMACVL